MIADARAIGDVEKPAAAVVVKQPAAFDGRHEDILAAVIVVIRDRGAERVSLDQIQPAAGRDVGECVVVIVAIQAASRPSRCAPIGAVDKQQVGPAIPVGIEHRDAAAKKLGVQLVAGRAVAVDKPDAGTVGDVHKCHRLRSLDREHEYSQNDAVLQDQMSHECRQDRPRHQTIGAAVTVTASWKDSAAEARS